MKNLLLKIGLVFPGLLFAAYILIVLVGCIAGLLHCSSDFYCGPFCFVGEFVIGVAVVLFFFSILPDIKAILNIHKNAASEKK